MHSRSCRARSPIRGCKRTFYLASMMMNPSFFPPPPDRWRGCRVRPTRMFVKALRSSFFFPGMFFSGLCFAPGRSFFTLQEIFFFFLRFGVHLLLSFRSILIRTREETDFLLYKISPPGCFYYFRICPSFSFQNQRCVTACFCFILFLMSFPRSF